jgi:hypothetical protein
MRRRDNAHTDYAVRRKNEKRHHARVRSVKASWWMVALMSTTQRKACGNEQHHYGRASFVVRVPTRKSHGEIKKPGNHNASGMGQYSTPALRPTFMRVSTVSWALTRVSKPPVLDVRGFVAWRIY